MSTMHRHFEEFAPPERQQRKSLRLKVLVFEIGTEGYDLLPKPIREHDVDFSKKENRLWLCNLIVWASHNNKLVEICNYKDYKNV